VISWSAGPLNFIATFLAPESPVLGSSCAVVRYEAALFKVLTHKQTDMMLAKAEMEMASVASWATEQTFTLAKARSTGYDSIAATVAASAALSAWLAEVGPMAAQQAGLHATIAEVNARRQAEERENALPEGLDQLNTSWGTTRGFDPTP